MPRPADRRPSVRAPLVALAFSQTVACAPGAHDRPQGLFRPLIETREISLPVGWVSLADGCHAECGRRSSRLATVRHPPTRRIAPWLRAARPRRRLSGRSRRNRRSRLATVRWPARRRRGYGLPRRSGAWLHRSRLADLCCLLVTEIHIPLGWRGRPGSTGESSDCENACRKESPAFHGSLLSQRSNRATRVEAASSVPIETL